MNILVTGANGQLGTEMRNYAAANPGDRYVFTDVNSLPDVETVPLDATNIEAVRITCDNENIDVIVNCAAYTNVDKAEDDMAMAELINATAPYNLATVAAERGATLIHISTDYVFKGDASVPYTEDMPTEPTGVYGVTKLKGEKKIEKSGCKSIIIRTAWLYSPYGRNFLKTMMKLTAEKPERARSPSRYHCRMHPSRIPKASSQRAGAKQASVMCVSKNSSFFLPINFE